MPKLPPVTFILGVGRSGTTLLRVMLAGHSGLFSPPEMFLASFETMAEREAFLTQRFWLKGGLRRALMDLRGLSVGEAKAAVAELDQCEVLDVYRQLQGLAGGRMIVDKAPVLSYLPKALPRLEEAFEAPRYVWIVRHPGSVIRSFQNMPMAEMMFQGLSVDFRNLWFEANKNIENHLAGVPNERWTRVRYEDLVREPDAVMRGVCDAIGVRFEPAILTPYEGERMRTGPRGARAIGDPNMAGRGGIQPELADKWLKGFDPRSVNADTRALAKDYGYDLDAMPPPPIAKVSDGIQELMDLAMKLEKTIRLPMDLDDVEGRRFLLRMLGASIDTFVEHADVEHPRFHHAEGPTRKMFADCPDTDYRRAPIRVGPGRVYRLRGRLPKGTTYAGILLYGRGGRVAASLHDGDFGCDDEGNFEVLISTEEQPGVSLRADGDENSVMVRQYFGDRGSETPLTLSIDRVDAEPVAPLDAQGMVDALARSRRMLKAVFERTRQGYEMARTAALNQFVTVPVGQLFPTPDNQYKITWYRFGPDQLLIVRGRVSKARYFGLSLCNAWMESYDYTRHVVNLNHTQIQTEDDGSFEVVVSHRDFGHPNRLDTAGHHAGYLVARWLLPEEELAELSTRVVYQRELVSE